jgi:hypothetical protein
MLQNLTVKPVLTQAPPRPLSFNMRGIDEVFPGFLSGDFAVLYGSPAVTSLISLLCVRAQLPVQLGGLGSNVVFIDGGNTFRLYNIARLAQFHQLHPAETLERIFISRAFTAYQLTALIMEKLEETLTATNAKLVVVSDLAGFFLDANVAAEEAQRVYSQIMDYLANFAIKHQIIIISTYLPYEKTKRNNILQELTTKKASTVLYFAKTPYAKQIALEKHSVYKLGITELPSENRTLTDYMGVKTG